MQPEKLIIWPPPPKKYLVIYILKTGILNMKIRITEKHKHRPSDYLQTATVQDFKSETTKLKSHQKE